MNENRRVLIVAILTLVVGLIIGYLYGNKTGFKKGDASGYQRASADIKKLEQAASQKAAQETAKAANPFQAVNPLEGVESNPFEKAKNILNPFK